MERGRVEHCRSWTWAEFTENISGQGARRGLEFTTDDANEPELVRYPLSDGVFIFTSPSIRGLLNI
jgi:hypothetical protein